MIEQKIKKEECNFFVIKGYGGIATIHTKESIAAVLDINPTKVYQLRLVKGQKSGLK